MSYGICSDGDVLTNERGDELANFSFCNPELFYEAEDGHTPGILCIIVKHLGKNRQVNLDLRKFHLIQQIRQAIPTAKVLRPKEIPYIEAHILEFAREPPAQGTHPPLCFRQHGFHKLTDGTYVFVAGNEVLGLPEGQKWTVTPETARLHLGYNEILTLPQAVQGLMFVLARNQALLLPIFGFTLLSSTRSLLNDMNITTFPSIAVIGGHGFGKTTTCQRFALLYDDTWHPGRRWGEIDACSTLAATIEVISRYRDQVVLLDDIAKSISPSQVRKRNDLLAEILRFATNGTSRKSMNHSGDTKERYCTAGLAYTGEFPLDNSSDIERTVPVRINRQLQNGKQEDRVLAATVFRYFIQWFLPQVNEAIAALVDELDKISGDYQRLKKNRVMLLWALRWFLYFALERGKVAEDKVDEMWRHAIQACDNITRAQIHQITCLNTSQNLSYYILDGIQKETLQAVSKKDIRKHKPLPAYYYVHMKSDEAVYVRTEVLDRFFSERTPLRLTSSITMNKRLTDEGIICSGKESRAAGTRIYGQRYLKLCREDLIKAADKACHST